MSCHSPALGPCGRTSCRSWGHRHARWRPPLPSGRGRHKTPMGSQPGPHSTVAATEKQHSAHGPSLEGLQVFHSLVQAVVGAHGNLRGEADGAIGAAPIPEVGLGLVIGAGIVPSQPKKDGIAVHLVHKPWEPRQHTSWPTHAINSAAHSHRNHLLRARLEEVVLQCLQLPCVVHPLALGLPADPRSQGDMNLI